MVATTYYALFHTPNRPTCMNIGRTRPYENYYLNVLSVLSCDEISVISQVVFARIGEYPKTTAVLL